MNTIWNTLTKRSQILSFCAFARHYWERIEGKVFRNAVIFAENFYDVYPINKKLLLEIKDLCLLELDKYNSNYNLHCIITDIIESLEDSFYLKHVLNKVLLCDKLTYEEILREIHNPFRKSQIYNSQVRIFAESIYKNQSYEDYPVLHDMLLDFGCNDENLLNHLLKKDHLKGCWALDQLLGKF